MVFKACRALLRTTHNLHKHKRYSVGKIGVGTVNGEDMGTMQGTRNMPWADTCRAQVLATYKDGGAKLRDTTVFVSDY